MRHLVLCALAFSACSEETSLPKGSTAMFDLHQPTAQVTTPTADDDFYALPFPNNLRLRSDGTVDLSRYPRPPGIVGDYINAFDKGLHGFGTNSGIFFRFASALDPTTLPADANASVATTATAFVIDVTPGSPTYGQRSPVIAHFVPDRYDFIGPNWMVLLPFPGRPLREKTTYAALLTDGVKTAQGAALQRSADFKGVMQPGAASSSDPAIAAAATAYKPLTDWLATQPGLATHVVIATVFTTVDATSIMKKLRQAVYDQAPAPTLQGLAYDKGTADYSLFEGTYIGPNFQEGDPPYATTGGALHFDAMGNPLMVRTENLRVAMTVPTGTMPAAGWPVVIYAHGTGGNYMSFVNDGSGPTAAKVTASDGSVISRLAMISIDQVLHGTRDPTKSNPDYTFINFNNIVAGHANLMQGGLDDFQLLRLVKAINVATAPMTNQPIKFDATKIYFKGHSEGGLTGPAFLAYEPEVKAAVLSGSGGVLIQALLNKTEPADIPALVGALLHDPLDQYHPVVSLLQNYFEDIDPENYARLFFREPPAGQAPKSIYQSLGIVDHYTPIANIKALALAMGVQPVKPDLQDIDGLDLAGLSWASAPMSGNVASGAATGVLCEYTATTDDGHFVVFDIPSAIAQNNRFLATHAATGTARLDPP
jgi:predicted esterase